MKIACLRSSVTRRFFGSFFCTIEICKKKQTVFGAPPHFPQSPKSKVCVFYYHQNHLAICKMRLFAITFPVDDMPATSHPTYQPIGVLIC